MGLGSNLPKEAVVRTSFARYSAPMVDRRDVAQLTIVALPDIALLEIFDFCLYEVQTEAWHTLVHVCRKWRNIVFGSPHRLDLRLYCTASTPVTELLDVWPPLPIVIRVSGHDMGRWGMDNLIAALEHNNRICDLNLWRIPNLQWENVLSAMQEPLPVLTRLELRTRGEIAPVIPTSFLGGSTPRLQTLFLDRIPFPGLPKLLLSATQLADLRLWNIPHSGYISPDAMVTSLSVLTGLERLVIEFESPRSRPAWRSRRPPPSTRTLLPVLAKLRFNGVSEYLEDLVALIDAPLLRNLDISFFHQLTFETPQLTQFVSRSPKFESRDQARVVFYSSDVSISLPQPLDGVLELRISCREPEWQLSALAQVCSSPFSMALIPAVERLYIHAGLSQLNWQDDFESSQWLELFQSFTFVKDLYISRELVSLIARALRELVGERATEVLPALQTLFLEEIRPLWSEEEAIGQFVAARQFSNHPIAISRWERKRF